MEKTKLGQDVVALMAIEAGLKVDKQVLADFCCFARMIESYLNEFKD